MFVLIAAMAMIAGAARPEDDVAYVAAAAESTRLGKVRRTHTLY
jgi:hypothetical protein